MAVGRENCSFYRGNIKHRMSGTFRDTSPSLVVPHFATANCAAPYQPPKHGSRAWFVLHSYGYSPSVPCLALLRRWYPTAGNAWRARRTGRDWDEGNKRAWPFTPAALRVQDHLLRVPLPLSELDAGHTTAPFT